MSEVSHAQLQKQYDAFKNSPKYSLDSEEIFCICRKPDTGKLMVACDGCDEWFHFKCMGLNQKNKDLVKSYYCKFCDDLFHKGKSLWKRKCKLIDCYKPVDSENNSQFCSKDHGIEYWKSYIAKFPSNIDKNSNSNYHLNSNQIIEKNQLHNLFQVVSTKAEFENIGNELPVFNKGELIIDDKQREKLDQFKSDLQLLNSKTEIFKSKLQYLIKLKEIIAQINEILTQAFDPNAEEIMPDDNEEITQKKKTKAKSKNKQKSKRFKVDICGFDKNLLLDEKSWQEFISTPEYSALINTDVSISETKQSLIDFYKKKISENDDDDENDGEKMDVDTDINFPLDHLCFSEKRKCISHNGWYNVMKYELDNKINEQLTTIEEKKSENDELNKFIQIKNWKRYCDEV